MSSPSVGTHLRRLREGRGMSLEEIARATRVSSGYLHALEADDFASLPAPVFTRGFIRAYCQSLGEAPETALGLYDARAQPTPAMADSALLTPTRAGSTRSTPVPAVLARNLGPLVVSSILLLVLGVALFTVTFLLQSGRDRGTGRTATPPTPGSTSAPTAGVPATAPVATPGVDSASRTVPGTSTTPSASSGTPGGTPAASPAPPGAASDGAAPPATATQTTRRDAAVASTPPAPRSPGPPPSVGAPAGTHRLIARTSELTWMRVRTEDGRVTEETIPAGQEREWRSTGTFRVTVGNAGGVRLEVDGRAVPPLGPSGAVANLVLPAARQ